MGYNPVDIELLKDSVDTVSVIGQYVELKRAGSSWKGLCPFHREKTPSFFVFPERGTWKCFGCDSGGDIISFLGRYKGLDFIEVVEELAEQAGVKLKIAGGRERRELRSPIYALLEEAQRFFTESFRGHEGREAREYLQNRKIDENLLRIGIGHAPGGNALLARLQEKGYSVSSMVEAGVVKSGESGPYDFFRNRLTFPIRDRRGRVVSFGGRTLDNARAKYLNGPETAVYTKGSFLYGYSRAQKHAREQKRVILVEGYFDHARLLSEGFHETVAASGTAFTERQARNLMGMAERTLICYDGDAAGNKASVKVSEVIMSQGGFPEIVKVPGGMDPDDFILKNGPAEFEKLLENAMDPVSFCVSLLGGSAMSGSGRVAVARRLLEVASSASSPLVEEDLLEKVERHTGFSRTALIKASAPKEPLYRAAADTGGRNLTSGDKTLLRAATAGGRLDRGLIRFLQPGDMLSATGREILAELKEQLDAGYATVMLGEMDTVMAGLCADISGFLEFTTTEEISRLKRSVERSRRELPRRKRLLEELATADPVRTAEILEDLGDGGGMDAR